MSCTSIYLLGLEKKSSEDTGCLWLGSVNNAWRGAMYVWNQIAKDYFNEPSFPFFNDELRSRIWNAKNEFEIEDYESVVLNSTMDKACVAKEDLEYVISCMKKYGEVHPNSSLTEQAELLDKHLSQKNIPDGSFIAFQQTSCGEFWAEEWDEDEQTFYNPNVGTYHFLVGNER